MRRFDTRRIAMHAGTIGAAMILAASVGHAQRDADGGGEPVQEKHVVIQPSIGVQTMWFNGNYPVSEDISPGRGYDLPLGGGISGPSNGLHLGLEVLLEENSRIRFPISFDAMFLSGKTTFPLTRITEHPTKRLTLTHSANIFSGGLGVTVSFFKRQTIYVTAEAKVNYIPSTTLTSRTYFLESGVTDSLQTYVPDPDSHLRYGAYLKVGSQVEFFEPFLLDFSIGYGGLNLIGRNTDPATQRNLLVVDDRHDPERLLGYIGIGFSVVWKL